MSSRRKHPKNDFQGIANGGAAWLSFAKLQLLIWLIPAIVYFWIETHQDYPRHWIMDILNTVSWTGTGVLITLGLCVLYERIHLAERSRYGIFLIVAPLSILSAFLWFAFFSTLEGVIGFSDFHLVFYEMPLKELFHNTFKRVIVLAIWHLVGLVRVQAMLARLERERSHSLEKASLEAQIRQLRGSLNPHFLFNSLNSAISLVDEEPSTAKEMMLGLSVLLRETLSMSSKERTLLKKELELIRRYVDIESIRFEEDLIYEENIGGIPESLQIPPFLLLPLVENAIKHGMRTSELPLRINVEIEWVNGKLTVEVQNTGHLGSQYSQATESGDTKLGVKSIAERLALELPGKATFTLREKNGWVVATLEIKDILIDYDQ